MVPVVCTAPIRYKGEAAVQRDIANVMAGADCGFSSQAMYRTEVHPTVVWEKFKALRQGADIASKRLWQRRRTSGGGTRRQIKR